jgi:hypothetical protein
VLETLAYSDFASWMVVSPWAYPAFLTAHGLGMAVVVGLTLMVALRILGYPEQLALSGYRPAIRLGIAAFIVNATSGTLLFVADAVTLWPNPAFQFKLVAIVIGILALWLMVRGAMRRAAALEARGETFVATGSEKAVAILTIVIWCAAVIVSGRLIAYLAPDLF